MQTFSIETRLRYRFAKPSHCLFQFELAAAPGQRIIDGTLSFPKGLELFRVAGEEGIGSRFWLECVDDIDIDYCARLEVMRPRVDLSALSVLPPHALAEDTVRYLMSSRYCEVGEFERFVTGRFGKLSDGAKVQAMRDWIAKKLTYSPGASDVETGAMESFVKRSGVCRDYAHLMIAFARAAAIPARMASVYAPRVDPQDFHAVAQLFLADENGVGDWYFVDPTDMAQADEIGLIGVGRDAADISFMTSYGMAELIEQSVRVRRAG